MHERFVGSLTTAGVGDGPTETCLQLYESNISGVAGTPAQKENQFSPKNGPKLPTFCRRTARTVCEIIDNRRRQGRTHWNVFAVVWQQHIGGCRTVSTEKRPALKWQKNYEFSAKNSVFLARGVSFRAPYPILRVPDPVKCVGHCIGATYWVLQGRQQRKKTVLVQRWLNFPHFWAKNSVFLENNWVGGTPLSYVEGAELKKKVSFGLFGYKTSFHGIFVPIL